MPCSPWSTNAHIGANPKPRLVGRLGAFLVRMRGHQRGVDIDDDLTAVAAARAARPAAGAGPRPRARACARACRIAGDRGVDVAGQGREQPRHRRIGGDQPEQPPAGPGPRPDRPGSRRPARPRSRHRAAPCPDHDRPRRPPRRQRRRQPPGPGPRPGPPPSAAPRPRTRPTTRGQDREPDSRIGLRFTYGVPSSSEHLRLSQSQESQAGQALPCVTRRDHPQRHEIPRLVAIARAQKWRLRRSCWPAARLAANACGCHETEPTSCVLFQNRLPLKDSTFRVRAG